MSESNAHDMKEFFWLVKCSFPALDIRRVPIAWFFLISFGERNTQHKKAPRKCILSRQDAFNNSVSAKQC